VNSAKEVIFLDEIREILEAANDEGFVQIQDKLFYQLAKSIASPHLLVGRHALYFWSNEKFCTRVRNNIATILPVMFPSVYEGSNSHWNEYGSPRMLGLLLLTRDRLLRNTLHELMVSFLTMNPQLFNDCWSNYMEQNATAVAQEARREHRWQALRQITDTSKFVGETSNIFVK
jgi:hypothetical protein